jgi:signal transduction histidine kinase
MSDEEIGAHKPIKILLIEDDPHDADLFQDLVRAEAGEIELQWTHRLYTALEQLRSETVDIVVTDLDLPDSKGLETFTKIHTSFPYIPVVVLSGLSDQATALDAVHKGAQDYLIKGQAAGDSMLRLLRYSIERQRLITECERNLKEIKTLRGLIPMCAWCRKVHNQKGYWEKVEKYIEEHTDASFSHGICPECMEKTEPELFDRIKRESPELFESRTADMTGEQQQIRVLLIEDDPGDADLVRALAAEARDIRLDIRSVDRLSTAVEILQRESFDLILSDLGLPDSQGIETFIRIYTVTPDVPIVLLTGISDKELAATAVRSGAQDYVVKGEVDSALLQKTIQYAIERHKMLMELRSNFREVKKMQRERENILSMFAHDIKNAIIPSAWLLSRIMEGKKSPADSDVAPIRDGLISAEHLLADFIEFSRFKAREYKPVPGPFDIEAAVRKQVEVLKPKADEKNIKISCEFSEVPFPVLKADGAMMERVISNLLDNAFKYTTQGGSVAVKIQKLETKVIVMVRDTGIGIPEAHIPHVFDAFYRVPGTEKGSGLGLSIAKTIVKAHCGEIWVESAPGKGSTFSFTMPHLLTSSCED